VGEHGGLCTCVSGECVWSARTCHRHALVQSCDDPCELSALWPTKLGDARVVSVVCRRGDIRGSVGIACSGCLVCARSASSCRCQYGTTHCFYSCGHIVVCMQNGGQPKGTTPHGFVLLLITWACVSFGVLWPQHNRCCLDNQNAWPLPGMGQQLLRAHQLLSWQEQGSLNLLSHCSDMHAMHTLSAKPARHPFEHPSTAPLPAA
jgi:hypothetical protein